MSNEKRYMQHNETVTYTTCFSPLTFDILYAVFVVVAVVFHNILSFLYSKVICCEINIVF